MADEYIREYVNKRLKTDPSATAQLLYEFRCPPSYVRDVTCESSLSHEQCGMIVQRTLALQSTVRRVAKVLSRRLQHETPRRAAVLVSDDRFAQLCIKGLKLTAHDIVVWNEDSARTFLLNIGEIDVVIAFGSRYGPLVATAAARGCDMILVDFCGKPDPPEPYTDIVDLTAVDGLALLAKSLTSPSCRRIPDVFARARSDDVEFFTDIDDLYWRRDALGRTAMHHACARGSVAVSILLAPLASSLQDNYGVTPAEYALVQGHEDLFNRVVALAAQDLVRWTLEEEKDVVSHRAYLESRLVYKSDVLYDRFGRGVMMGWERILMRAHVEALLTDLDGPIRILNVGFGMGIFDTLVEEIARENCVHSICEPHPDVLARMEELGWTQKATVLCSTWQDACFAEYDAIFFDTYEEGLVDLFAFFVKASAHLRPGGRLSYYNGAAPYNLFFHMVQNTASRDYLRSIGCHSRFELLEVGDIAWGGSQRYWQFDQYMVPLVVKAVGEEGVETKIPIPKQSYNMVTGVLVEKSGQLLEEKQ